MGRRRGVGMGTGKEPRSLEGTRRRLTVGIFLDAAIAAEEAHARHARDRLLDPLVLVLERLIDERLRLDVAVEVVADQVVIAMVGDTVAQRSEAVRVAEHVAPDGIKHLSQVWVKLEVSVMVRVPQILDVFGQVSEQEDVRLPNFACDLDLLRHCQDR